MIMTVNELINFCYIVFLKKNLAEIIVTPKCNFKCSHCVFVKKFAEMPDVIKFEYVESFFNQLGKREYTIIALSGGEPTLYLDMCEQINNLAHNYGYKTALLTNGWWYNNNEIKNRIKKANYDFMWFSLDTYHKQFVNDKDLEKLILEFNETPIKMAAFNNRDENEKTYYHDEPLETIIKKHQTLPINCMYYTVTSNDDFAEMCPFMSKDGSVTVDKIKGNSYWLFPQCMSYWLLPNGHTSFICEYENSCDFGHVFDKNVNESYNNLVDRTIFGLKDFNLDDVVNGTEVNIQKLYKEYYIKSKVNIS